jgi:hypothetical protein
MSGRSLDFWSHPSGENATVEDAGEVRRLGVETFAGRIDVEWDPEAAVTALGQLAFFVEYLKAGGLFAPWVADCPLTLTSPNAPPKRDVLGTLLLSVLAGHQRYAHITCLRSDGVNPALLGMTRVVSEDAVRRALAKIDAAAGAAWLQRHLDYVYRPLLREPWILDVDSTVKPIDGRQEGAVVGYNPHKPGRPSHVYHTYMMAGLRLVLDVEVDAGNRHTSKHAAPGLWALLDRLGRDAWPVLLRGDADWGTEANMARAEQEGLPYLFKLRATKGVKRLIEKAMGEADWRPAGHGWQGREGELRLAGWSRQRRVVVLRRRLRRDLAVIAGGGEGPGGRRQLGFIEVLGDREVYETAVLVTSLDAEVLTLAQLYRDRADAENAFDELKNHWGWGGFTTHDLARCRLMARTVALVYDWWTLYARLADPDRHTEAITSRPLLLHAIARQTRHAGRTTLTVTSSHGRNRLARQAMARLADLFRSLAETAEQLTATERWCRILSRALVKYLHGRELKPPGHLLPA